MTDNKGVDDENSIRIAGDTRLGQTFPRTGLYYHYKKMTYCHHDLESKGFFSILLQIATQINSVGTKL
jgi:hypothetical protein